MILSKNYFLIYSSVYIVDLEQVITGGVIFFKKIVLYVWRTWDDRSYLIGKNFVKFLVWWQKHLTTNN